MDKLKTLSLSYLDDDDDQVHTVLNSWLNLLNTSKTSVSLETLCLDIDLNSDAMIWLVIESVTRFINLKQFTIKFLGEGPDNNDFAQLHRLKILSCLSIHGAQSITSDGLVNLVRHLPHLKTLQLQSTSEYQIIQLLKPIYIFANMPNLPTQKSRVDDS